MELAFHTEYVDALVICAYFLAGVELYIELFVNAVLTRDEVLALCSLGRRLLIICPKDEGSVFHRDFLNHLRYVQLLEWFVNCRRNRTSAICMNCVATTTAAAATTTTTTTAAAAAPTMHFFYRTEQRSSHGISRPM